MDSSPDSLEFFARYKSWVAARTLSIGQGTSPKEVASFLVSIRKEVDNRAFEILGIDTKSLDSYSSNLTDGMAKGSYREIPKLYRMLGSGDAELAVGKASDNSEQLKPFAKAYLFKAAMRNLGIFSYVTAGDRAFGGNAADRRSSGSVPFSTDGITFAAKYKDWIAIKKMSINPNTKPEEISAHLSSIRIATDRKEAEILGIDIGALDIYAESITGKLRKSAANLERIIDALDSADGRQALDGACSSNASLADAARTYLFSTMMQNLKFDVEVSPQTLMDMFPGLKIPKPKGRMPGQKKKKP
ncbi:MAG: DUF2666 family protein [Candidatus Micrarchaeota archaeon]|nr:DUF2666 family protein [Candidatus Micrarchaeota archaeon]